MTSFEKPEKKLLTKQRLLAVFFVQLNEAYQISVLLPIVVFMCRDFGIASQWLGVYTSILNASFGFCQFLVSYLWGYMSDIYGRRRILLLGIFGTFISMTIFGFSTSFVMAMISRCCTGFFNGNLGVVKAYLADITDSSNRGYAFSIIGVSFGAGIIMGSMLGGILIETNDVDVPDDEYIETTSILKFWIFESRFPFLLPTAVCGGIISLNALFWTLFVIKDVERSYRTTPKFQDNESIISIDVEMASTFTETEAYQNNGYTSYHKNEYLAMNQSLPTHHEMKAMITTFEPDRMQLLGNLRESKAMDDEFHEIDIYALKKASDLFKYTKLGHALLQYGTAAIAHMMFKEMAPVFMAQALEFNSQYIGYTQAWSGGILLIFCIWIQPLCLKLFKHTIMTPICAIATAFCTILMPSVYWFTLMPNDNFTTKPWWLLLMIFVVEFIITCTVSIVFVTATCWVNNSVPNIHVGKANGIGQTLASFVRGFGPLMTGFIWSESFTQIENGSAHYAVYYAYIPGALFYVIMVIDIIIYIPANLQYTWEQREKDKAGIRE